LIFSISVDERFARIVSVVVEFDSSHFRYVSVNCFAFVCIAFYPVWCLAVRPTQQSCLSHQILALVFWLIVTDTFDLSVHPSSPCALRFVRTTMADSASESDSSSIDGGPIMMPPSPITREQMQKRIDSLQQQNRVLKVELETYKLKMKAMDEECKRLRETSVYIVSTYEHT